MLNQITKEDGVNLKEWLLFGVMILMLIGGIHQIISLILINNDLAYIKFFSINQMIQEGIILSLLILILVLLYFCCYLGLKKISEKIFKKIGSKSNRIIICIIIAIVLHMLMFLIVIGSNYDLSIAFIDDNGNNINDINDIIQFAIKFDLYIYIVLLVLQLVNLSYLYWYFFNFENVKKEKLAIFIYGAFLYLLFLIFTNLFPYSLNIVNKKLYESSINIQDLSKKINMPIKDNNGKDIKKYAHMELAYINQEYVFFRVKETNQSINKIVIVKFSELFNDDTLNIKVEK